MSAQQEGSRLLHASSAFTHCTKGGLYIFSQYRYCCNKQLRCCCWCGAACGWPSGCSPRHGAAADERSSCCLSCRCSRVHVSAVCWPAASAVYAPPPGSSRTLMAHMSPVLTCNGMRNRDPVVEHSMICLAQQLHGNGVAKRRANMQERRAIMQSKQIETTTMQHH